MIVYRELKSIERDLGFSYSTLYALSNNLDKHYHNVLLPKKDGTYRKLSVPDLTLKRVQRAIADKILAYYPVSRYACAYVPGSKIQKNAGLHIGKEKILKLDIREFFDNILYSKVKDIVFYKEKFSEPIRILLSMLCYCREGLPQGAPSSPAITNIILYEFDEHVGEYCDERNIIYSRYCDDMTFSGNFDGKKILTFVANELKKSGLFLNYKKTALRKKHMRQKVTGLIVNEKLNLPKEYKKEIRQEMYYIQKFGLSGHMEHTSIIDREKYINSLKGRIAFILQILPGDKEFLKYNEIIKREKIR